MDLPYAFVDSIAKMVPQELNITLDKALQMNPEFRNLYELSLIHIFQPNASYSLLKISLYINHSSKEHLKMYLIHMLV